MAITRKKVRDSLLAQLKVKGADQDFLIDRVDNVMKLWDLERKLEKAIKEHGVEYMEPDSHGVDKLKTNPANKERVMVHRQIDLALQQLGLTVENISGGDDDVL